MTRLIVYASSDEVFVTTPENEAALKLEYPDRDWGDYNRTEHQGTVSIQTRLAVW